jgi:pilus assembly protein CpaF
VIQVSRLNDGSRKILSISEVADVEDEHASMEDIFVFERSGMSQRGKAVGKFRATGYRPRCMERLKAYGVHISDAIFREEMEVKDK